MECDDMCDDLCAYLGAYLDGELNPEKVKAVREHLRSCPKARNELWVQDCIKTLIRERFSSIIAPDFLREVVLTELGRFEEGEYRDFGTQILDIVPWGTHIALLYKKKSDLVELLVPYMAAGLEENELCVWVTSEMSRGEAMEAMAKNIPHLQGYIDSGQMQFFSHEEWFLHDGRFDVQYVLDAAMEKYSEAMRRECEGLRITGNLLWLDQSNWDSFMEFEDRLNNAVQDYKLLVVCVYNENGCIMDNIDEVIDTHEYVLAKTDGSWGLRRPVGR